MDKQIKQLNNISNIESTDVLSIQKQNGLTLNISLDQLIQYIMDNSSMGISEYHFTDEGRTFIQDCFAPQNLGTSPRIAPTTCEDILPYCEQKATLEAELTLTVKRTILFAYDSYIYFNSYEQSKTDYYNYTSSVVLNDIIYYVRLQFWLDGHWTCAVSPANSK